MTVTLSEQQQIGGTCTNRGCIPSNFLLSNTKQCAHALRLKDNCIQFRLESIQPESLFQKKDAVVGTLRQRMEKALASVKIEWIHGTARLIGPQDVEIESASGISKKH